MAAKRSCCLLLLRSLIRNTSSRNETPFHSRAHCSNPAYRCTRVRIFSTIVEHSNPTSIGGPPSKEDTNHRSSFVGATSGTLSEGDETLKIPKPPSSHESPFFLYDELANKFINCMMWDGKKSVSRRIFQESLEIIKRKQLAKLKTEFPGSKHREEIDPTEIFRQAVENVMPIMGTTGIKKGGKTYNVPVGLPFKRRRFLGIKWIITAARERKGIKMADKLATEILDAYNNTGTAIKRKQDSHRLAEANRAFAHFRWT